MDSTEVEGLASAFYRARSIRSKPLQAEAYAILCQKLRISGFENLKQCADGIQRQLQVARYKAYIAENGIHVGARVKTSDGKITGVVTSININGTIGIDLDPECPGIKRKLRNLAPIFYVSQ
jgi:hypothetical protein